MHAVPNLTAIQSITLVLVAQTDRKRLEDEVSRVACVGWEKAIRIEAVESRKGFRREDWERLEQEAIDRIQSKILDDEVDCVIADSSLLLNTAVLKSMFPRLRSTKSFRTLTREVTSDLKLRGLHWLANAQKEWEKSSIPCINPDQWVQQFEMLGAYGMGRQLLKGLRVISERELREAFKTPEADVVGLHFAHAYIADDEPGSSSLSIQNILQHHYPSDQIVRLDLSSIKDIADLKKDVFFVYEDGLWSGVELVKRLNAICSSDHFISGDFQLHFRYGITSDVGLSAARLFAKREKLGRIQFRASAHPYHINFLSDSVDSCLSHVVDRCDDSIRTELDSSIEPYAFRPCFGWGDRRQSALELCSEIGAQLVRPFLERREIEKKKSAEVEVGSSEIKVSDEKVMRWSLGALGFASTVVFSSSIPKPVLPLMWLDGRVEMDGKIVEWRPLFWDVRRTGQVDGSRRRK